MNHWRELKERKNSFWSYVVLYNQESFVFSSVQLCRLIIIIIMRCYVEGDIEEEYFFVGYGSTENYCKKILYGLMR